MRIRKTQEFSGGRPVLEIKLNNNEKLYKIIVKKNKKTKKPRLIGDGN